MLFNSFEFAIFLFVAFFLYWFIFNTSIKARNFFLFAVSYFFYGWWDWRFLGLLLLSSAIDYLIGKKIGEASSIKRKKMILTISVAVNVGLLGVFKYFNFFADSFAGLLSVFGFVADTITLSLILPVGISFYTFQSLSYTIDIYRGNLKPAGNWLEFFTFVAFFPQLVAGPIERATNLLPQFKKLHEFSYEAAASGVRLMLFGYFKKVVVADNCASQVNAIFNDYQSQSTIVLIAGVVFFAFQIYGDFSGYSDIARGVARLFGFELMVNFRTPYFARDIAEFWRRWHISLTTWFRDYVYIPLGGSKVSKSAAVRNTFIVFLLSGIWHGANWTFFWWGCINAVFFLPLLLTNRNRTYVDTVAPGRMLPAFADAGRMLFTFSLVCFAWIFFRAPDIGHALGYIEALATNIFVATNFEFLDPIPVLGIGMLLIVDWFSREQGFDEVVFSLSQPWGRRLVYLVLFLGIFFFGVFNKDSFIYFQF
jgi:alginate O-acetyltransferase complex protein AlgI